MLREIHEQPASIEETLDTEGAHLREFGAQLRARGVRHILLAARGTSENAATYARYLFGIVNAVPVTLVSPSLFTVYRSEMDLGDALVLGISQSGEATDVVNVLEYARSKGVLTAALTNTAASPISEAADVTLLTHAHEEQSVPATKTYTTALAAMCELAANWAEDASIREVVRRVPDWMREVFAMEPQIETRSERYRYMESCAVLARGPNLATAQETALKLMQTCYVVPAPYSSASFPHGPIATIAPGFPVFAFAPSGKSFDDMQQAVVALKRRKAELIIISDSAQLCAEGTVCFQLPSAVPEICSPMVAVVLGQLLAYHIALHKGINPDEPRGLHKVPGATRG
jgi:glucosamine--fructose-6-phosphate aminotransferase (isomerizing)